MINNDMLRWLLLAVMCAGLLTPALAQQDAASSSPSLSGGTAGVGSSAGTAATQATQSQQQGQAAAGQQTQAPTITNTDRILKMATEPGLPGNPANQALRLSTVERHEFQDFVSQSLGRELPMFGFSLFQNVPSTFAPLDRVPVTPDTWWGLETSS